MEKPAAVKDVATLDDIDLFKEQPSPAAIKPKEAPPEQKAKRTSRYEDFLAAAVEKETDTSQPHAREAIHRSAKQDLMLIFSKMKPFFENRFQSIADLQESFRQNWPDLKEQLWAVPVQIRQDALIFISAFTAIFYVFICFPFMAIARKLDKKHPWLIWIPVVHLFYFTYLADKRILWTLLYLVPVVNMIVPIWLFVRILKSLRKSPWLAVPAMLPVVNIILFWYLAISKTAVPAPQEEEEIIKYETV